MKNQFMLLIIGIIALFNSGKAFAEVPLVAEKEKYVSEALMEEAKKQGLDVDTVEVKITESSNPVNRLSAYLYKSKKGAFGNFDYVEYRLTMSNDPSVNYTGNMYLSAINQKACEEQKNCQSLAYRKNKKIITNTGDQVYLQLYSYFGSEPTFNSTKGNL